MSENDLDVFLKKVTEVRELSEEEKRQSLKVGRNVWEKAMEILKGRKWALLFPSPDKKYDETDGLLNVFLTTKWDPDSLFAEELERIGQSNADLLIEVYRYERRKGTRELTGAESYIFSVDKLTKKETAFNIPEDAGEVIARASLLSPIKEYRAMSDYSKHLRNQETNKYSYPDESDLKNLLATISSFKERQPSVKIVK